MSVRQAPVRQRGVRWPQVARTLQGTFEGLDMDDADAIYSVLAAVYPQGESLSTLEATEALLRAGFERKKR